MKWLADRWFLVLLLLVLAAGLAGAGRLQALAEVAWLQPFITAGVLFVMALLLETSTVTHSLTHPGPALLACLVNMGLVPLVAWAVSFVLPEEMGLGLCIAAAVPCTLASAAVWTRRAGGNDAAALFVTLITNVTCFAVTPLWVWLMTGRSLEASALKPTDMAWQLAWLVVLPMAVAQLLRRVQTIAQFAARRHHFLAVLAQGGILGMVFLGAIQSGSGMRGEPGSTMFPGTVLSLLIVVSGVHLVSLCAGLWSARGLGWSRADQIAVAIAGSQKTLMVGLVVANALRVTILPMVAYQVLQLILDTFIADHFRRRNLAPGNHRPASGDAAG
jgi:sodium/bile acid cotransporter 7